MKRLVSLPVIIVVCFAAASTEAAVTKIKDLAPVGVGILENPNADGVAILATSLDSQRNIQTEVNVTITGFLPNTVYGVAVEGGQAGFWDPDAITTNSNGVGHFRFTVPGDATGPGSVTVTIYREFEGEIFEPPTANETRAVGAS